MKSKQEKLKKLLLTKCLLMAAVFSIVVGSTPAVACTHVDSTTNGCPIVGHTLDKAVDGVATHILQSTGWTAKNASTYPFCLYDKAFFPYVFDVYAPGGAKGSATANWVDNLNTSSNVPCYNLLAYMTMHVKLKSVSSVQWATTTAAYNPSSYLQCCQPGT